MPKTVGDLWWKLPEDYRTGSINPERDRYLRVGTVSQGERKPGKEDPQGEYLTKGGHSINATKVIKLFANKNYGKFSLIATQCPTHETINSFLELIFTSKIDAVVVLGSLSRGNLQNYWEPNLKEREILGCDPESVDKCYKLSGKSIGGGTTNYCKYDIRVTKYEKGVEKGHKDLVLFHYIRWPDDMLPVDRDSFESFVKMSDFRDKRKLLVHCSAGIGRTGVFAACLQALKEQRRDPFEIVKQLRKHRTFMVHTFDQFDYVCKFIARNCTAEGVKNPPKWDDELDYEKYFGKSEAEVKRA